MDSNFRKKIEEIEKLYNCWLYRNLSPMGKITVIKAMALSKLSHIILVCPHLDENYLDQLTKLSFRFLWSNKPDRVKRVEAILPISKGGINMPDIKCFWESLKCSWAKRMMQPNSAWLKVLQANILY